MTTTNTKIMLDVIKNGGDCSFISNGYGCNNCPFSNPRPMFWCELEQGDRSPLENAINYYLSKGYSKTELLKVLV